VDTIADKLQRKKEQEVLAAPKDNPEKPRLAIGGGGFVVPTHRQQRKPRWHKLKRLNERRWHVSWRP